MIPDTEAIRDEHVRRDICGIVSEFESIVHELPTETLVQTHWAIMVERKYRQEKYEWSQKQR